MQSLDSIGLKTGTDKSSGAHDYLRLYEKRLAHLRNMTFTMFEVGVYNGGSAAMWSEFFPSATIVGIDINPDCKKFEQGNVKIRIGDQTDIKFLMGLITEFGAPTVFLDDGSHRWDDQVATLHIMYPFVVPEGIYICEDIDTSFDRHLLDADFKNLAKISTYDYLNNLSRMVVGDSAVVAEKPYDLFIAQNYKTVDTIEMSRRTCLITKLPTHIIATRG